MMERRQGFMPGASPPLHKTPIRIAGMIEKYRKRKHYSILQEKRKRGGHCLVIGLRVLLSRFTFFPKPPLETDDVGLKEDDLTEQTNRVLLENAITRILETNGAELKGGDYVFMSVSRNGKISIGTTFNGDVKEFKHHIIATSWYCRFEMPCFQGEKQAE